MASEGDTRHPTGEFVVALNKLEGPLPAGRPSHPEAAQLIDIRGPKMELLYDFPTYPEPHYAQMIRAEKLKPKKIYSLAENKNPHAIRAPKSARGAQGPPRGRLSPRDPHALHAGRRARGAGDTVYFHVTNLEQDADITHGFGVLFSNLDMQVEPGETKTLRWVAERAGVTPFYCSNFCSALHQEMQGYLEVMPSGTLLASVAKPSREKLAEVAALLRR